MIRPDVFLMCVLQGMLLLSVGVAGAAPDDVTFPAPVRSGGMGVFSALQARRDVIRYDNRLLHWEALGNMLWAACGINRPDDANRTIPVLTPSFALQIYLLAEEGAWQYDPLGHRLIGIVRRDLREMATASAAPQQTIARSMPIVPSDADDVTAPVVLLFAATDEMAGFDVAAQQVDPTRHLVLAALQAGHATQNIQLVGVSEGIGVQVLLPPDDAEDLGRLLGLSSASNILLTLRVGYPAAQ